MDWRKSTYSDANGGACVETASNNGQVLIRDTTSRNGATLTVTTHAWQDFTRRLR